MSETPPLGFVSLFFPSAAIGRSSPPPRFCFPSRFLISTSSFRFYFVLKGFLIIAMALWQGFNQQLRRVLPKAAGEPCLTQSRRYVSSTIPRRIGGTVNVNQWGLGTKKGLQLFSQGWKPAQRSFSASAQAAHGHIHAPKPGEE